MTSVEIREGRRYCPGCDTTADATGYLHHDAHCPVARGIREHLARERHPSKDSVFTLDRFTSVKDPAYINAHLDDEDDQRGDVA